MSKVRRIRAKEALGVGATSIFHDIQQIEDSLLISHAVTPNLPL